MSDSAGVGFFRFLLRLVGVKMRLSKTICVGLRRLTRSASVVILDTHNYLGWLVAIPSDAPTGQCR